MANDNFFGLIEDEVRSIDPKLVPGNDDFRCMALVILIGAIEIEKGYALDASLASVSGYPADFCGQVVVNLQLGGCLKGSELDGNLQDALSGDDGAIILNLLTNIAQGRMLYMPETQKYQLTEAGKLHVESLIRAA